MSALAPPSALDTLTEVSVGAASSADKSAASIQYDQHPATLNENRWLDEPFNFEDYLHMFDLTQKYHFQHIATGTNVTFRVTKQGRFNDNKLDQGIATGQGQIQTGVEWSKGVFPSHQTLIIKYSPPYFASSRGTIPMTARRQQVEAKALSLFGPGTSFSHFADRLSIIVPQLIHFDIHSHVLVMSEIEGTMALKGLFKVTKLARTKQGKEKKELYPALSQVGSRIGQYLGDLHAPATIALFADHDLKEFQNDEAKELNFSLRMKAIKTYLTAAQVQDHLKIESIIEDDFKNGGKLTGALVFAMGDLGADTILVSSDIRKIGLIGWQYSGPGRGMNGDMAKLVAQIRAYMLLMEGVLNPVHRIAEVLLMEITTAYRRSSRENLAPWAVSWDGDVGDWGSLHLPTDTACILRSAFILYGSEMILAGILMEDVCGCQIPALIDGCKRRMKFMREGCWHIRMAGVDEDTFSENWEDICEQGSPLVSLVLGD